MLKVLIAPAAYKGTLSPGAVAQAIRRGVRQAGGFALSIAPLADGGDGTIEALRLAVGGQLHSLNVRGPNSAQTAAVWLQVSGDFAVVELASACGIGLVPPGELSPLTAHTYGLGQVLVDCLGQGARDIVIAVGGSASTDGGTGALAALGASFLDAAGNALPLGGAALLRLACIQLDRLERLPEGLKVRIATDVESPLTGPGGAAFVFGPQKGASEAECELLDRALGRLAVVMERATGRSLKDAVGSGAAGGAAFGLSSVLGAEIISGFHWVAEQLNLVERIKQADIVVTGEGCLDSQTLQGKGVGQLAQLCRAAKRPLWAISARCDRSIDWRAQGFERVLSVASSDSQATVSDLESAACRLFAELAT
jgi:glycerate kinase